MCFYGDSCHLAFILRVNHHKYKERNLGLAERVVNRYEKPWMNFRNASVERGPDLVAVIGKLPCSSLGPNDFCKVL